MRSEKWTRMLLTFPLKKHSKIVERARKGIPSSIRGEVWFKLSRAQELANKEGLNLYEEISKHSGMKKDASSIVKDISRTFPKHIYFIEKYGRGQTTLFNILKALSLH